MNDSSKINWIVNKVWKFFSSLKLALTLFICLVISTMIGSILLQRPIAEPGQLERVYSPETIVWLDRFDFLDVFHSWWFVLQLFLLTINVTITSIDMWPRFKRRMNSFRVELDELHLPQSHVKIKFQGSAESLLEKIKKSMGSFFRTPTVIEKGEGTKKFFIGAQSAWWAHLGVYVIHTGLVLILLGGLITAKKGFEGTISLAGGESAHFYWDRKEKDKKVPLNFEVRCLKTWMERYPDGTPKSYFSELEIVDHGQVVAHKTIKVNEPLEYKGIYFYQATFGQQPKNETTEFTLEIKDLKSGKIKTIKTDYGKEEKNPFSSDQFVIVNYVENMPIDIEGHKKDLGEAIQIALKNNKNTNEHPEVIWAFKNYPDFDEKMRRGSQAFTFKDFKYDYEMDSVTGLQVARNPGIQVTWIGSTLLLIGLVATFWIPHRKLWCVLSDGQILIAAHSHRHPESFMNKVKKWVDELQQDIKGEVIHDSLKT